MIAYDRKARIRERREWAEKDAGGERRNGEERDAYENGRNREEWNAYGEGRNREGQDTHGDERDYIQQGEKWNIVPGSGDKETARREYEHDGGKADREKSGDEAVRGRADGEKSGDGATRGKVGGEKSGDGAARGRTDGEKSGDGAARGKTYKGKFGNGATRGRTGSGRRGDETVGGKFDGVWAVAGELFEGAGRPDVRGVAALGRTEGASFDGAGAGGGDVSVSFGEVPKVAGSDGRTEETEPGGMGAESEHGGTAGEGGSAGELDLYEPGAGGNDETVRVSDALQGVGAAVAGMTQSGIGLQGQEGIGTGTAGNTVPNPAAENVMKDVMTDNTEPAAVGQEREKASRQGVFYHIEDDHLGEGGPKEKFRRNLEVIRTLKLVEAEGRAATPKEQKVLSGYVGWGGLADAFSEKADWAVEAQQLKEVLSEEEYAAARATTLDAFYTSPAIIQEIYRKLEDFGFTGGNVLEPSMGVGNFFGAMPEGMRRESRLFGVEKDGISGRIGRLLYPEADIHIAGFEETQFPESFFDVVVGNIPFGDFRLYDRRFAKENFLVHDYFIARALEEVRSGGIVALITSAGTLDKAVEGARRYYAARAELLGAVRLPNNAFKANAGTDVTADILFFKRRQGISAEVPEWVHTVELESGIHINNYVAQNPEMMLGEMALVSGRFGPVQTLLPREGADLAGQLREALLKVEGEISAVGLDGDLPERETGDRSVLRMGDLGRNGITPGGNQGQGAVLPADAAVPNYSYVLVGDAVYFRTDSVMQRQDGLSEKAVKRIKGLIPIRDCARELIDMQLSPEVSDEELKEKMRELRYLYGSFIMTHALAGTINGVKVRNYINTPGNRQAFGRDASFPLLSSLEVLDEDGNVTGD